MREKNKFLFFSLVILFLFLIIGGDSRNKSINVRQYSIDKIPQDSGSITVTSPTGSDSWKVGIENTIQWQKTDVNAVVVELYKGGSFDRVIISYWTGTAYYWTLPLDLDGGTDYQIKVTDYSNGATYDYSDYFTIVEAESKSITITNPTSSTSVRIGLNLGISWTSTGNINQVRIELYKGGAQYESIFPTAINDGSYSWTVSTSLSAGTDYQIKIADFDDATVFDISDYFTITDDANDDDANDDDDDDDDDANDDDANDDDANDDDDDDANSNEIIGYDLTFLIVAISLASIFLLKKLKKIKKSLLKI